MVPVAASIWALNWLWVDLNSNPERGLRVDVAGLLVIAWIITALTILGPSVAKRIKEVCGVDVLRRAGKRPVWIGVLVGMILSTFCIFGPHIL